MKNQPAHFPHRYRDALRAHLDQGSGGDRKSPEKSDHPGQQLRGLSRRILSAQESGRKKISRALHDVIARELMDLNARLVTLRKADGITPNLP